MKKTRLTAVGTGAVGSRRPTLLALVAGLAAVSLGACNRKGDVDGRTPAAGPPGGGSAMVAAGADGSTAAPKDDLDQEEQLLTARGDLIVNRQRISERRQELLKEREQLSQGTAVADPQALARLQTEDQKLLAEEQALAKKERELLS